MHFDLYITKKRKLVRDDNNSTYFIEECNKYIHLLAQNKEVESVISNITIICKKLLQFCFVYNCNLYEIIALCMYLFI